MSSRSVLIKLVIFTAVVLISRRAIRQPITAQRERSHTKKIRDNPYYSWW